ncbi:MAG: hypothetical protein HY713_00720 [candidate division NC10 bacterium]|nr:hypothetical protein [candidate division NC10 bacterium]
MGSPDAAQPPPPDLVHQALLERLERLEREVADIERERRLLTRVGWIKVGLSAVTALLIGFTGPLLTTAASLEGPTLPTIAWIGALAWGVMSAAKDIRSQLDLPPVNGGPPAKKGIAP